MDSNPSHSTNACYDAGASDRPSPHAVGFEECFQQHYLRVHSIALRLTRSLTEADDVAQTVFLKFWSAQPSVQGPNLRRWLTVVTTNAAIDRLRHKQCEAKYVSSTDIQAMYAPSAEREALGSIDSMVVASAVGKLREDVREVIIESFVTCKSHRGIASDRAVPLGTVKTRIRSGLLQLRRSLRASGLA